MESSLFDTGNCLKLPTACKKDLFQSEAKVLQMSFFLIFLRSGINSSFIYWFFLPSYDQVMLWVNGTPNANVSALLLFTNVSLPTMPTLAQNVETEPTFL